MNGVGEAKKVILLEEFEENGKSHLALKYFEHGYPKGEDVLVQWKESLVQGNRIIMDISTLTDYYMIKNGPINYFITEQVKTIGPDYGKGFYVDEIQVNSTRFLKPNSANRCKIGNLY